MNIENLRRSYAEQVTSTADLTPAAAQVQRAFATVPREGFVGPGPWKLFTATGYVPTPDADLSHIYRDAVVCLREQGLINNGQPSLHARCLAALCIQPGEIVVHIGAGTGYYSAIASELTGPTGKVFAYEIEADLAARAAENLAGYANVSVAAQSGSAGPIPECDAIYVNAGSTAPLNLWLDALRVGGRMLFPLTSSIGVGGMLLVTKAANAASMAAEFLCSAMFIPCIGARDDATAKKLSLAFISRNIADVKSLRLGDAPDDTAWFAGSGWWLSTAPAS